MKEPTENQMQAYNRVTKLMKAKGVTQTQALRQLKINNSTYFIAKSFMTKDVAKTDVKPNLSSYQKVADYLKLHPTASITTALAKTKTSSGAYYTQKRKFESKTKPVFKRKYNVAPKVIDIPVDEKPASKAVIIVCDPNDIKEVVSNLF